MYIFGLLSALMLTTNNSYVIRSTITNHLLNFIYINFVFCSLGHLWLSEWHFKWPLDEQFKMLNYRL